VLEAPEQDYAREPAVPRRTSAAPKRKLRRDFTEDFADDFPDEDDAPAGRRQRGVRVRFRWGLPRTKWGRLAAGFAVLVLIGIFAGALLLVRNKVMHDPRFFIQSASSIEIQGNVHLTRDELVNIFGQDVERNIFYVSLAERRAELQQLPWVEHATVMRLLPNRLRVSIVERTPVAFVRQGSRIGLVDASGVLLDMPRHGQGDAHYSFPVVTGIAAGDAASTRAARMKIFEQFTSDLDSSGEHISEKLSEVDLSNPEDVKALIPEQGKDVLVHFGDTDFLNRYRKF
jgi:cell division protein FtsQ